MKKLLYLAVMTTCFGGMPPSAWAGADGHANARRGHLVMQEARRTGEVLALVEILQRLGDTIGDDVIDVEFEKEDGVFKYAIYYLDRDGRRHVVHVDARSGEILDDTRAR